MTMIDMSDPRMAMGGGQHGGMFFNSKKENLYKAIVWHPNTEDDPMPEQAQWQHAYTVWPAKIFPDEIKFGETGEVGNYKYKRYAIPISGDPSLFGITLEGDEPFYKIDEAYLGKYPTGAINNDKKEFQGIMWIRPEDEGKNHPHSLRYAISMLEQDLNKRNEFAKTYNAELPELIDKAFQDRDKRISNLENIDSMFENYFPRKRNA